MSETILKNLPLKEVEYKNEGTTALLTFLDVEQGQVLEVALHKGKYDEDKNKYIPDAEQAKKIEKISQEYFGCEFDKIEDQLDSEHDIYVYEKFSSLYHVDVVAPFKKEEKGKIFTTKITAVKDNGTALSIRYDVKGQPHQTKMNYSKFMDDVKKYIPMPTKKNRQLENFEKKFGVPFEEADKLIGQEILVEVKMAFNKFPYGEIKDLDA